MEMENDGGAKLAKMALCMASCAACHQWPNALTKVAVVASLAVALACEATRLFGRRKSEPGIHNLIQPMISQLAVAMGENPRGLVDLDCVPCEETRQGNQETKSQKKKIKTRKRKK